MATNLFLRQPLFLHETNLSKINNLFYYLGFRNIGDIKINLKSTTYEV